MPCRSIEFGVAPSKPVSLWPKRDKACANCKQGRFRTLKMSTSHCQPNLHWQRLRQCAAARTADWQQTVREWLAVDALVDLAAGMTLCTVALPQALAYAELAQLPAIHGLLTSVVAVWLYAAAGGSRRLSVGPF